MRTLLNYWVALVQEGMRKKDFTRSPISLLKKSTLLFNRALLKRTSNRLILVVRSYAFLNV